MYTQNQIDFLNKHTKGIWRENPSTHLVDIEGDFYYSDFPREVKFPLRGIRFGEVTGNFIFESSFDFGNRDLDGFPYKVGGDFSCSRCGVTSLKGGPKEVGGNYTCSFNEMENFEGSPERINQNFIGRFMRKLTSFKGLPTYIGGDLNLDDGNSWEHKVGVSHIVDLSKCEIGGDLKIDGRIEGFRISGIKLISLIKSMVKELGLKRDVSKKI